MRHSQPAVRAAYMKDLFTSLEERGCLGHVAGRDGALVGEIATASRTAWLPIGLNVRTVEAVCAGLGEERGLALLAECVYAQFDRPLWKNFIGPAIRILGREPGALGRWIPRALQLVFRDTGVWSAESTGEAELRVAARELPEELARHRVWLRSLGIGMRPLFLVCETDGTADLERVDVEARSATYRLTWKPDS